MNIPANNCAILQKGDDLEQLSAGQHYITNPNVTLRGLFTLGENQIEMPTKDMCVHDSAFSFVQYSADSDWQLYARSSPRRVDHLPEVVSVIVRSCSGHN